VFLRRELGWPEEPVEFRGGQVRCGERSMAFDELVAAAYRARVSLSATGFYRTPDIHFDKAAGRGRPFYYYAYGAAASEVIVDVLTGEYRVLRTDIVHDAGESLNPAVDLGQIEGGFVQGLGWLTCEELLWNDEGLLISDSPANYKIPTAHDCPAILNVTFHRSANPEPTIFRSTAVGEPPLMLAISAWCALRDACSAAADHRLLPPLAVPATPEAVLRAIGIASGTAGGAD
jgi:xanthine dehydrogenase large subunit